MVLSGVRFKNFGLGSIFPRIIECDKIWVVTDQFDLGFIFPELVK